MGQAKNRKLEINALKDKGRIGADISMDALRQLAEAAGWTDGYTPSQRVAATLNAALDGASEVCRARLLAEVNRTPLLPQVGFVSGFTDFIGGNLAMPKTPAWSSALAQIKAQEGNELSTIDISTMSPEEKRMFIQAAQLALSAQ